MMGLHSGFFMLVDEGGCGDVVRGSGTRASPGEAGETLIEATGTAAEAVPGVGPAPGCAINTPSSLCGTELSF
jgi:hypothetical protein